MRIFLLGDFQSDNGPGNANKQIKKSLSLKYEIEYSREAGKVGRIFEMYQGVCHADMLIICSESKINYQAVKLAKMKGKKIVYLMHGYSSYEHKIEHPDVSDKELKKIYKYEHFIFDSVDRIVCVSNRCMNYMKSQLPQYADKFDYIFNVVDIENIERLCRNTSANKRINQVLSVGGGMKIKNILSLVEAAGNKDVVVVGKTLADGDKIRKYNNVTWYEHLTHNDILKLMTESSLYIQNSIFETFCLAVVEALFAGCSILVSDTVGCLDLFDNLLDEDVIYDVFDQKEISKKMEYLLKNPNNERLLEGFKRELVSKEWQANRWQEIINSIISM
ncbi:MAG: glycosyltransferase family 4 protein [Lachnobacterium sp.]|nr:glycosyltransferase family 4 protein [Lachnobacterium sp.]